MLCREDQGKFPDYPSDEEGGSALIFNPESVLPCDSDGEGIKKDEKGKKEEKKEGEEEEEKGFRLPPSDFLDSIKTGEKSFNGKYTNWTDRRNVVCGGGGDVVITTVTDKCTESTKAYLFLMIDPVSYLSRYLAQKERYPDRRRPTFSQGNFGRVTARMFCNIWYYKYQPMSGRFLTLHRYNTITHKHKDITSDPL